MRDCPQPELVGVQVLRWSTPYALDFGKSQPGLDDCRCSLGNPILKLEDITYTAVEPVGPEVRTARCFDELGRDTQAVVNAADTAFEHVSDAQLAADPPHIHGLPLVSKGG